MAENESFGLIGKRVIDIVTRMQDELFDESADEHIEHDFFRSPFVHAEALKEEIRAFFMM